MAWPCLVKNTECGIGASFHSLEKCSASIRNAVKLPDGVACPDFPVETGQVCKVRPSRDTVSVCEDLSTLMRSAAEAQDAIELKLNASTPESAVRIRMQLTLKPPGCLNFPNAFPFRHFFEIVVRVPILEVVGRVHPLCPGGTHSPPIGWRLSVVGMTC